MRGIKYLTTTLKTILGSSLIGGLLLWSGSAVAQTAPNANEILIDDGAKTLQGISQESNSDPPLIDQSFLETRSKTKSANSPSLDYQIEDFSGLRWEIRSASYESLQGTVANSGATLGQDWFDPHRGDGVQNLIRLVIWRF